MSATPLDHEKESPSEVLIKSVLPCANTSHDQGSRALLGEPPLHNGGVRLPLRKKHGFEG